MDETLERLVALVVSASANGVGDGRIRVPTERELAGTLGVNRSTVREKLSALEVLGLIRRTQGSGTYLDMPHSSFVRLYFDMSVRLGYVTIDALQEAREMLEREIVRKAAVGASAGDLAALERCIERMLNASSAEEGDQADHEYHLSLFRASRNPAMLLMVEGLSSTLWQLLKSRRYRIRQVPGGAERTDATHIPILEAIRRNDPDGAEEAMDEHFRVWNQESRKLEGLDGRSSTDDKPSKEGEDS